MESEPASHGGRSARDQRIIAGFEEIERFVEAQGRLPQHGEGRDISPRTPLRGTIGQNPSV